MQYLDFFDQLDVDRVPVPTHYLRMQMIDDENHTYPVTNIEEEIWVPVPTRDPLEYANAIKTVLENYYDTEFSGRSRVWIETQVRP